MDATRKRRYSSNDAKRRWYAEYRSRRFKTSDFHTREHNYERDHHSGRNQS